MERLIQAAGGLFAATVRKDVKTQTYIATASGVEGEGDTPEEACDDLAKRLTTARATD